MLVFWVETPCELVDIYQRFRRTYCLYLQPEDGGSIGLYLHGFTTQKTNIEFFTAVRTANLNK
jgi:hypothetical protein